MAINVVPTQTIEAHEVEYSLREHLAAFARGDFDGWGEAFAPEIFFTAADPEEVFWTREAAVAEMHRDFDPAFNEGLQIEVEPLSFQAGVSPDGKAAWTASPLRYGIHFQEETSSFMLRHTSLLKRSHRGWLIVVTQYSLALPEEIVLKDLTAGHLPPPHSLGYSLGAGTQALVGSFKHQLADVSMALIHPEAQVFGPFPGEQAEGDLEARALFAKWTSKWGGLRLRPDGIRAEFVSERMGWVAANVEAVLPYAGQRVSLPLRALVVYQKEGEHWETAHLHLSLGIPDELMDNYTV